MQVGDNVANFGKVAKRVDHGMFVVLAIHGWLWSLDTGTGDEVTLTLILHCADGVVLVND